MSVATADALLKRERVGAIEQKLRVVVGFKDQTVAPVQAGLDQFRHDSQISAEPEAVSFVVEDKAGWVLGIVGHRKGVNDDIPDSKPDARLEKVNFCKLSGVQRKVFKSALAEI